MGSMEFLEDIEKVYFFEKGHLKEEGLPRELLKKSTSLLYKEALEVDPEVIKKIAN